MKINVGTWDRWIRGLLGAAGLFAAYLTESYLWAGVGSILALTAGVAFCPLYTLMGFNTGKKA